VDDVWACVQRIADRDGSRIAVAGTETLTYEDLRHRVSGAARLITGSCGPGDVVALALSSTVTGLVQILAAQAAGAVFLPLDLAAPPSRTRQIVSAAGARMLISDNGRDELDVELLAGAGESVLKRPELGGYLIFTSGSTGAPKGLHVSSQALSQRLAGLAAAPGFPAGGSFLSLTPLSFDISLAELLLPLSLGGRVVAAPAAARRDVSLFDEFLQTHRPDVIQATPAFWRLMIASDWRGAPWASMWCGGEHLTTPLAAELMRRSKQLWNVYGPTEATIWATAGRIDDAADIALGQPLPDTGLALLDEGRLTDRPGTEGEIVLCGAGLAEGYIGDLGGDAFFTGGEPPRRCYRTGDRARITADGQLHFLGRLDSQIKLRGNRVELGEIETVLERLPDVIDAVVFPRELDAAHGGYLVACLAVRDPAVGPREIRRALLDLLPAVMVPRHVALHRELPRSSSGKLDRARMEREWRSG
jgi:D-alanine--poly(phosphoribitol) ligase subunit 1